MEDLKPAIEKVRSALFIDDDELDQFNRIVERLEGYEIAYNTLLKENERLKEENDTIPQLQQIYMIVKGSHDKLVTDLQEAQQEIKRLKSDHEFFANQENYGHIVLENADLLNFKQTAEYILDKETLAHIEDEMNSTHEDI